MKQPSTLRGERSRSGREGDVRGAGPCAGETHRIARLREMVATGTLAIDAMCIARALISGSRDVGHTPRARLESKTV